MQNELQKPMAITPRGMFGGIPRTPRTPTTNQPFFSDPDDQNNNPEVETKKASGSGLNDVMQIQENGLFLGIPYLRDNPRSNSHLDAKDKPHDLTSFQIIF